MPDANARPEPHPPDDGFDALPTRVAYTPEEAPTTMVDLSQVGGPSPAAPPAEAPAPLPEPASFAEPAPYAHEQPAYEASYPREEHEASAYPREEPACAASSYPHQEPPYEPSAYPYEAPPYDAPYTEEPASERGWGPQVPDDLKKTTFFERDRLEAGGFSEPADETRVAVSKPSPQPQRGQETTRTFLAPRKAARPGALVIGAVCVAAGVMLGTALGIAASRGGDEQEVPAAATASVQIPEPEPARRMEPPAPAEPPAPEAAPAPAVSAPAPEPEPELSATPPAPEPAPSVAPASDPLDEARLALRDGDATAAAAALARARETGADPLALARVEAELAVMRGDGALAVPRLRDLAEAHRDASLYASLGRALVQAEQDRAAADAFGTALELDPRSIEGHLGMAGVHARAAALGPARRHHREAEEAARSSDDAILEARVRATGALILLESGQIGAALREAEAARRLDGLSSEAALLQARIARVRNQPADAFLRQAMHGRAPAPMAIALLAESLDGDEACDLASRYLERAPQGFDAPAMRRLARRCR